MLYYAELYSDDYVESQEFPTPVEAIEFFENKYKGDLMCVIQDNDPKINVIYFAK